MSDLMQILDLTFRPPQSLLDHLNKYPKVSDEAKRWLNLWKHWPDWLKELEQRATDEDERLLRELAAHLATDVTVTEVKQATLIEVKEKPTI